MKTSITFRHLSATEALKDYVNDKLGKIDKFELKLTDAHVVLSIDSHQHNADVTLHGKNITARGEGQSEDMYSSIDAAVHKVQEILRRHKEKLKAHPHS